MAKQQTLWGLIAERARSTPHARLCLDNEGRELSFGHFKDAVLRTAQGFYDLGFRENDRIAWQLPTTQEAIILSAALNRLGVVQIPLFPTLRENEIHYICEMAKPKLLITPSHWKGFNYEAMAAQVKAQLSETVPAFTTMVIGKNALPSAEPKETDLGAGIEHQQQLPVRWIFCTSGTTSNPKAALHIDTPFITIGYAMNAVLEISSRDVIPMFFPFTHVGGLMWLASTLLAGSHMLLTDTFDAEAIDFASDNGSTVGGAGTAFHLAYLNAQKNAPDQRLFPAIRTFTGGGAPKPPELHHQMKETFDSVGVVSGYGLTECPIISMNTVRDPDDKLANTEGRLLPGMEIKIVKTNGDTAGPEETGEIRVKGPHLCVGFLDETLNKTAFDSEGYFSTGDIGFLDQGGWLTISGRIKDVIIRKGENISAKKIEDVLYKHPDIIDAAVIGLPDPERGEMACAVIQIKEGANALDLTSLKQHCLENKLVIQEVPERLEHILEIPRNLSGKVLKEKLKALYC